MRTHTIQFLSSSVQETDLQLHCLKFYSTPMVACASFYYKNLDAYDPASRLLVNFQVQVDEHFLGALSLTCSVAKPRSK